MTPQEIAAQLEELAAGQIRVQPDAAGYRGVVSDESLLEFHLSDPGTPLYVALANELRAVAEGINDLADLVEQWGQVSDVPGEADPSAPP